METSNFQSVVGTLGFLKRLDVYEEQKPYHIYAPAEAVPGGKSTNEEYEFLENTIQDLRHQKEAFDIDKNGFEIINCPPVMDYASFSNKVMVETIFLPQIESAIKDKLGASHAWVYDWKIRRRSALFPGHTRGGDSPHPQPAQGVHVGKSIQRCPRPHAEYSPPDFKPDTLLPIVKKRLSEQMQALLGARFQAINFWQPLFGPLQDWPLAICDFTSLDIRDLVPVDHVYPDRVEETYCVYSNPSQRWYYLSDQQPDEAIMFKTYDSELSVARCAPHVSFALQDGPTNARLRESIEVRLFVSYYENE